MINKVTILTVLFLFSFSAQATCKLPPGEVIKVGCTYDCDFFYRFRLKMTAWMMGHSVKIVNLQHQGEMENALKGVDGILLPGGADIDPKYYLNEVSPELQDYTKKNLSLVKFTKEGEKRDPFEYSVVKHYSENDHFRNVPMLGICRGLQMMSVAQGIPLYLDIKTELGIKNRRNLFDRVYPENDGSSLIATLYQRPVKGYKLHHQGIRVPYYEEHKANYPQTKVTAFSNDRKIAEAIEYTHRPALGVQFHPERSFSKASVPVFKWFLNKACEYKTSSKE